MILNCAIWKLNNLVGATVKVWFNKNGKKILEKLLKLNFRVLLKVAEHSFSARSCWCNLARAQGFQKTNIPSTEQSFYFLKTRTICVIFLYNCMQCIDGFSILLQRYVKVTMQRTQQFSAFVCYRKNPVKCNARAVAQKIETDCFSRNVQFSSDPVVRISRNLVQK